MGPEESAALAAKTARVRGKKPAPEVDDAAKKGKERERAENLDDPQTQWRIMHPEEMRYTLDLDERGAHEIVVKTAFSFADIHDRGALEDLESFHLLIQSELGKYARETGDPKWAERDPGKIDVVLTKSVVKRDARAILAKLSHYAEPWKALDAKGKEVLRTRPTVDELAEGMGSLQMIAASLHLVGCYHAEVAKRKKSRKTLAE